MVVRYLAFKVLSGHKRKQLLSKDEVRAMAEKQFQPLDLVHLSPDSVNLTGEYAVMTEDGTDVHFRKSIEQARGVKRQRMQANPGTGYGIFEMRGSWDRAKLPEATGQILDALQMKEFTD